MTLVEHPSWIDLTLQGNAPLVPGNAVAALLVLEDGRYIMQLRDAVPNIFYPDHWGCFGGAVNDGETPLAALMREVGEELEYVVTNASEFTRFDFDFSPCGYSRVSRIYFIEHVPGSALQHFALHEGAAVEAIRGEDLLNSRRVTPYDAFAIWMHMSMRRFQL